MVKNLKKKIFKTDKYKADLLNLMPRNCVCAEIGVWKGEFSDEIVKTLNPKKLHLVDPWEFMPKYKSRWYGGTLAKNQKEMDKIFRGVVKKFSKTRQVSVHREYSDNAAKDFKDDYFDWVYIDGDHSYKHVLKDLRNYYPKVKKGGYLTGDDLLWGPKKRFPVLRGLAKFFFEKRIQFTKLNTQFVLKKT